MLSSTFSRRAAGAFATTANRVTVVVGGTTITTACPAMAAAAACSSSVVPSSSLLGSSLLRHVSSAPQTDPPQEFVPVLKLNMLQDNPGAVKKKRRIGRGIGSSKGKTSGRGHKGQKARAGGSIPLTFEGGQTRFFKLLPKRGFTNKRHKADMLSLNVGTIQDYIDMGRLTIDEKKKRQRQCKRKNTGLEHEGLVGCGNVHGVFGESRNQAIGKRKGTASHALQARDFPRERNGH
mmetsp:Transcript_111459/g.228216  ORF Transcript_111459/g.228216 Transcript_111459/m.228216 type:complete len:235 (-) Transcript_111459:1057-1761(-)